VTTVILPDIQDLRDERGIEIDQVGISGVRYPIRFNDGVTEQQGIAVFDFTVTLPEDRRGTHMSRMVEVIHEHLRALDPSRLPHALKAAADRLDVEGVRVAVAMPIGFLVAAPESNQQAWQVCDVTISAQVRGGASEVRTSLATDVTSLCPCSKAISDYGAHNQRSLVTLTVTGSGDDVYPLDVATAFEMIRTAGSCPVFPLVKRVDERALTMRAHDHPAFVEDMARDLSRVCRSRGLAHEVTVRNFESIHSHDAIASLAWAPA